MRGLGERLRTVMGGIVVSGEDRAAEEGKLEDLPSAGRRERGGGVGVGLKGWRAAAACVRWWGWRG